MTTTIEWKVESLECVPSLDGKTNVVKTVHWRCWAIDGDHQASVYSTQSIGFDDETNFTDFADLTQDEVIEWVKATMGDAQVTAYENAAQQQLDALVNPPVIVPELPWADA